MQFAASGFGSVSLGSVLVDPGASDDTAQRPILTEINGVDVRAFIAMNSLRIQDTVGQPVTANFTMVSPSIAPVVGDRVKIKFHEQVIFAGTIDHVTKRSPDLTIDLHEVDCLDWTQTLMRRKIRRNFIDVPIRTILDSLLDNELVGEELTIGMIESGASIPLVDSRNGRAFDICREMAGATGQTFYVDFDKSIQMRSAMIAAAPLVFSEANVLLDGTMCQTDRETYRNVQTVIVKGTAPEGQDALETTQQRRNDDQIAARAAIEGGTGIYEEVEEITHPTSNDGVEIALLGIGYARLRLATSGTPRTTIRCQVRGYGFRGGQIATVNLPTFGLIGTYVIQRVSIREQDGQLLFHDLELTSSSLQQRAYESWLSIVRGGKVTVQMPTSLTNNLATFNTPGTATWTVPAGVTTAEFTCLGGSGAGGGKWSYGVAVGRNIQCTGIAYGGAGGNSGKAITTIEVEEGEVFDLVVGAAGSPPGNDGFLGGFFCGGGGGSATAGDSGELSSVKLGAITICQGNGGGGGGGATGDAFSGSQGVDGSPGSGVGDAVSVGGGKSGGDGNPKTIGLDGLIEVRW
jgi:hypothetical protein